MIIRNIVGLIAMKLCLLLNLVNPLLFCSYFMGDTEREINSIFDVDFDIMSIIYTKILKSNIYYKGEYKHSVSNKVDIFICNHFTYYDFMPFTSIIRKFDSRPIYFITMEYLMKIPGVGILSTNHILLDYKKQNFKDNCMKIIKNINEGIIVILPEGEIRRPRHINNSNKFCNENNLPLLKNTIYPKNKGLYTIIQILKEQNKLGCLIDFTMLIENYKPEDTFKEIIKTFINVPLKDTFINIKVHDLEEQNINTYDNFKKWFMSIWYDKDEQIEYIKNNKKEVINEYSLYNYNLKPKMIIYLIITFLILIFFINNTNGIYIPISIISSIIFSDLTYNRIKHNK